MYGLKDEYLKTIIDVLKQENVKKAILFGSRAKGNYKEGSDIDLAIVGDEKKINYILNEETNIPYFFDILNLEKISNENLKAHIKRVGKNLI
jgi:predicted nucleotidyltransferase